MLPDFPAGLDFVTSNHTDIPYYKQDGKQWIKMGAGTWENWWTYNGMDTIATSAAHPNQISALIKQGNIETYDRQRKLIKPLIYMGERGIRIDVQGMLENKNVEQAQLDVLVEELHKEVGYEINQNSPQQLMKYFYTELKIKPYKKKNAKGQYVTTTDVDAMKRIARRGYQAAQIMLDIRGLSKRISTYLNIGKVDKDGRYRSSYKPVGAETGRLSSGETIFGTGGNQQNWPHDLLRYFLFDEGYIGYSFDLSQIENRIVAYVGGVISQIKAFENGIDLHKMTASVITGKPYDDISDEAGSSPLGDGRQTERYWGKKGNHAVNYDVGVKKFALVNELSEKESKEMLERIHRGYPQIRNGYHATIQRMMIENRTVTSLMGRKRLFLGPIFQSNNTPKSACQDTFREGYAQLPQSTTADKINEHGLEYIYYNQNLFKPIELLAQIHDSIVFQIPLSVPWIDHAVMLNKIKESLEQPLYWHGTKINTPCDLSIGLNMCKDEQIEIKSKDLPLDPIRLATRLAQAHDDLRN
jgi:DNA polymerase-1